MAAAAVVDDRAPERPPSQARPPAPRAGVTLLSVRDCRLLKDGRPYRGIGVNMVDLLPGIFPGAEAGVGPEALRTLGAHRVPFVRFPVLPFRPADMRRIVADPEPALSSLDPIVREAERSGVGLIPSVFFAFRTLPQAMGEPVAAWGDAASRTSRFATDFARRLAARHAGSKAIWMWEFANEANDWADRPDGHRFMAYSFDKTAKFDKRDNYSTTDLNAAFARFKAAVRAGDPGRLVTTGHNSPTPRAWRRMRGLPERDSVADFRRIVAWQGADADMVSMHVYPQTVEADWGARFADRKLQTSEAFIPYAAAAARAVCKPLFLGEFGPVPLPAGAQRDPQLARFRSILDAIVAADVSLAAMWVYSFRGSPDFSATYDNALENRLHALGAANTRLAANSAAAR